MLLGLNSPMSGQRVDERPRQADHPATRAALRPDNDEAPAGPTLQGLPDGERARVQVDRIPRQAQCLALS